MEDYLNESGNDLSQVLKRSSLQKLYIRFCTCLPASAAVERLFSHAGLVMTKKRTRLGDKVFECLVLCGVNNEFVI